jgi:hypothetical protein
MDNNIENNPMNLNTFAGQWKQLRGTLKSWWGKLNDLKVPENSLVMPIDPLVGIFEFPILANTVQ